ncbi:MAG: DUF4160 domain-containing protein [FCB group bacterium]|nr:DUF4160 domain-containing protein [FCB group bacterium]
MPEICRFFGIIVSMNYNDHQPPHFHVRYGDNKALILIETLSLDRGSLPPRAMGMVLEWALIHKQELIRNWYLASKRQPLNKIEPLE